MTRRVDKMNRKIWLFPLMILMFPLLANALYFTPGYPHDMQIVGAVNEIVLVSKEQLFINFKGDILIDRAVDNTSWLTFEFSPEWSHAENISGFVSTIKIQSYDRSILFDTNLSANYSEIVGNYSRHKYNVSIDSYDRYFRIIYEANYSVGNVVNRIREAEYSFYFISPSISKNQDISFWFPNKYTVLFRPDGGEMKFGENYQIFLISGIESKKFMYFAFHDEEEQAIIDDRHDSWLLLRGALLGAALAILAGLGLDYLRKDKVVISNVKVRKYKNHDSVLIKILRKK